MGRGNKQSIVYIISQRLDITGDSTLGIYWHQWSASIYTITAGGKSGSFVSWFLCYVTNISIIQKCDTIMAWWGFLKMIDSISIFLCPSYILFLVTCSHNWGGFPTMLVLMILIYMFTLAEFVFPQKYLCESIKNR